MAIKRIPLNIPDDKAPPPIVMLSGPDGLEVQWIQGESFTYQKPVWTMYIAVIPGWELRKTEDVDG